MAKDQGGKGGGARKIGRNKNKCERYRFRQKGVTMEGNKKPRGIGNRSKPEQNEKGYVDRLAMIPEDKFARSHPQFIPVAMSDHLCTELFETGRSHPDLNLGDRMIDDAKSLAARLRRDRRTQNVLHLPKREDNHKLKRVYY